MRIRPEAGPMLSVSASTACHPTGHSRHTIMDRANHPNELADRLRQLRLEIFGEYGAPILARQLGIATRLWLGYETGRTVPATILIRLVEMTPIDAAWLLNGRGPMYRTSISATPHLGLFPGSPPGCASSR
jgi:hypothetical protein